MISKLKLILCLASGLLIFSFLIWLYSLTERLESEREKRVRAEDRAAIALIERDVALAVSEEQSLYAEKKEEQAAELESMLSEIKDMREDERNCETFIINSTLERLYGK